MPAVGTSLPAPTVGDQAIRSGSYKRARGWGEGSLLRGNVVGVDQRRDKDEQDLS